MIRTLLKLDAFGQHRTHIVPAQVDIENLSGRTQVKSVGFAVHLERSKSSNTVLLSTMIGKDCPLCSFINLNWLLPTAVTCPSTSSTFSVSCSSSESGLCVKCFTVTLGLIETSLCTEESRLKSNWIPTTEFCLMVMGKVAPVTVAIVGLKAGVSSQAELTAHELIGILEWFTMVITA
jgi:hypothetical protein